MEPLVTENSVLIPLDRWKFLVNPADRNQFHNDLIVLYTKGLTHGFEKGKQAAEEERKLEESRRTLPLERGVKTTGSIPVKRRSEET